VTTRIFSSQRVARLLAAGTLAAVLALLLGITAVSPSVWNVIPFVDGVRGPSASVVNPAAETVGASDTSPIPFVDGIRGPSAGTAAPSAQTVGASDTSPIPFVNGIRGPSSIILAYSDQTLTSSSTSPRPFVNGVRGATAGAIEPILRGVSSLDQVATPQVDRGSSSSQVIAPSSFSSSPAAYPLSASSSQQVVAPGSFSSSPVAHPLPASGASQVIVPGSFSSSPMAYPLPASSSPQVIGPSLFDSTSVTYPRSATASPQALTPLSFAVTPEVGAGPPSSSSNVLSTTVDVPDGVTHDLTMQVNPSGSGTTIPPEGIHTYPDGTVVPLSAFPSLGWEFDSWGGDPDCADASVTMNADKTCIANFSPSFICGDVNCDTTVDAVDALFVLQYVVGMRQGSDQCPPPAGTLYLRAGNVNCDGQVDAVDALFILQYVVGIRPELCVC